MKDEKITKAADNLVQYLNECGSASERDLTIGGDTYKPFYRVTSMFWACTLPYLKEILDDEIPTLEEAKQIAIEAHPFFVDALLNRDEMEHFEHMYNVMKDCWE